MRLRADGQYDFLGRRDHQIKTRGYRVELGEVEAALVSHPDVLEAAIVPSPDPLRLSVPKAFITLRQGVAPSREVAASIFAFAREKLAPYKRIRRIEFRELPKTISGKIRRVELRREEAGRGGAVQEGGLEYREEDFAAR